MSGSVTSLSSSGASPASTTSSRMGDRAPPYSSVTRLTASVARSPADGSARVESSPRRRSSRSPTAVRCVVVLLANGVGGGGRVELAQHLAVAQVHVHATGQAGVEAADGPHDVDPLEVLPGVLLE